MTAIVGREDELDRLSEFVRAASSGAAACLLEGEAGAGKTTLWRGAAELAAREGFRVLAAGPTESEAKLSLAAIGDLLDGAFDDVRPDLPDPQRRALEVALFREEAEGPPPDERSLGIALLAALRLLARQSPVLVAVDDAHWIDPSSAAVLRFASKRLDPEPVGVLVAWRVGTAAAAPFELERRFGDRLHRIGIPALTLGALHRLLHDRLGLSLSRPTLRRIHDTSRGNPLFALELGRALERAGGRVEPGAPLPIPENLEALLRARIDLLPDSARDALLAAALLSEPTVGIVEAAGGASIAPAAREQLVEILGERIRFAHPLLAAAIHGAATPAARREIHRRLASRLTEPEERARHLALAAAGPDESVARELDDAAGQARARGARAAAAELAEHALRLTPASDPEEAARRALDAAEHHFDAGDTDTARSLVEHVLADPAGQSRARALVAMARLRSYQDDLRAASSLYRAAVDEDPDDPVLRIEARIGLGSTLLRLRESLEEAARWNREAARIAEDVGEIADAAHALGMAGLLEAHLGREEGRRTVERGRALSKQARPRRVLYDPTFTAAQISLWGDRFDEARGWMDALRARALEEGDEAALPYLYVFRGFAELLAGEVDRAAATGEEGLAAARQAGQETQVAFLLSFAALVAAHRGDVEEAQPAIERACELAERTGAVVARITASWAAGVIALARGRPEDALAALTPLREQLEATDSVDLGALRACLDEVEALVALGRTAEAEGRIVAVAANPGRLGSGSAFAAFTRCRGLLAAERGELEPALALLEEALEIAEHTGVPLERGRCLLALGSVRRRAKQKRAAREALGEAKTVFEDLGAALWSERASEELARIGGRAPTRGALTPTENRVAELVAEGRTNREVAALLVVSERTVEYHLTHVYAKLDVRSRAELARLLAPRAPSVT